MLCHLLFASIGALALALQKSNPLVSVCQDGDCDAEEHPPNASEVAFGDHVCPCCWRECSAKVPTSVRHVETLHRMTPEEGAAAAGVDAWLLMAHYRAYEDWDLGRNMYTPILETVKVALESKGAVVRIIGLQDLQTMLAGVSGAVAQGKRPLLLLVAQKFAGRSKQDKLKNNLPIMAAKRAGAYVVAYQSEPAFNRRENDGSLVQLEAALSVARFLGADEVWDYSRAHIANYPPASNFPPLDDNYIVRYVPPGYSPKLDVGVNMTSMLAKAQAIGYMGAPKLMSPKYEALLHGQFHQTNGIWSESQLRTYLETYPFQLSIHKEQTCCPREKWEDETMHVEAFRMSVLISNKACVISAPAALKDMQEYQGMVTFAEFEDTASTLEQLSTHLAECRERSYRTYKRVFAPEKILENSGFFQTWLPPHGK